MGGGGGEEDIVCFLWQSATGAETQRLDRRDEVVSFIILYLLIAPSVSDRLLVSGMLTSKRVYW